jgi:soluble lytic murein transglycosylase-like protein
VAWKAAAYDSLVHEQERVNLKGRTLEIAYGLSEYEGWVRAMVYNRYSKTYNISWDTYAAVAWTESRFGKYPLSHKGARGEMQLTRNPIAEICKRWGKLFQGKATLDDQFNNVNLGCLFLSLLITDRGDSLGICRYNGQGVESYNFGVSVKGEQAKLREIYKRIGGR